MAPIATLDEERVRIDDRHGDVAGLASDGHMFSGPRTDNVREIRSVAPVNLLPMLLLSLCMWAVIIAIVWVIVA
jgi:hypothetical protein